MEYKILFLITSLIFISGCRSGVTGYTTSENEDVSILLEECINFCAECNPSALSDSCRSNCNGYYEFGGIQKLERYTRLYENKCKEFTSA